MVNEKEMSDADWQHKYRHLVAAARSRPQDGRAWLELGQFLICSGDTQEHAIFAIEAAQRLLPSLDLRRSLGIAKRNAGYYDDAIALFREANEESPIAHGFSFLADALMTLDRFAEAREALHWGIHYDGDFDELYYLMGELEQRANRDIAMQWYRKAIELDPDDARYWHGLGVSLLGKKELVDAVSALRKSLFLDRNCPWTMVYLANALWQSGELDEAGELFEKAANKNPEDASFRDFADTFRNSTS